MQLLATCSAGIFGGNALDTAQDGYTYGVGSQSVSQKFTDIIPSAPKAAYGGGGGGGFNAGFGGGFGGGGFGGGGFGGGGFGGGEAVADISTFKVVHEHAGGNAQSYNGFEGAGLSQGYQLPYSVLLSNNDNQHENYKVIRVIHEYSHGGSGNGAQNHGHGSKGSKVTKTIKVIHDYGGSKGSGANSFGAPPKAIKVIHEKAPASEHYVPYDHLNAFNGGGAGEASGGFGDNFDALQSLKAINAFSNLGFSAHNAAPAEHFPMVHEAQQQPQPQQQHQHQHQINWKH